VSDFFVSYAQPDKRWAEWIAWTLEGAGFTVILPSRDFTPGGSFLVQMQRAISESKRMVLVLSPAYVESQFVQSEWSAAFASDPTGKGRTLVPVRVEPVEASGLLAALVYVDLVGKSEEAARDTLLKAVTPNRAKPETSPSFPAAPKHVSVPHQPLSYPGSSTIEDPPELLPYVNEFRERHPDPRKHAFIIMRFGEGRRHQAIADAIKGSLASHDIVALRADDHTYADFLMSNVRTYMHGCGFAVAVFERIESESHNPNVALEVGYMLALGKRVCLLKDQTLKQLPTDMVGSLYSEFDLDDVAPSIQNGLSRWLRQRGLAKEELGTV
jgi:hypothetical protein